MSTDPPAVARIRDASAKVGLMPTRSRADILELLRRYDVMREALQRIVAACVDGGCHDKPQVCHMIARAALENTS